MAMLHRQFPSARARSGQRRQSALLLLPLALAASLLTGTPVAAEDSRARDIGGWVLTPSADDKGCFLTRHYDGVGNTTLLLGLDIDGTNRLSLLNDNWSIAPQARLKLDFRLSGGGYIKQDAIGLASNGQKGFVTTFDAKFPGYFATSAALHVARGAVPVEQVSLAGSGAAVVALRRCVDARRAGANPESEETPRSAAIPKDPFASDRDRRTKR